MDYKEIIKSLTHDRCKYEIDTKDEGCFCIELYKKDTSSFLGAILCNTEEKEFMKKVYDVLKYYNFKETWYIKTMSELNDFTEKKNYSIKLNNNQIEFLRNDFENNTVKRYTKNEIEEKYNVKINLFEGAI